MCVEKFPYPLNIWANGVMEAALSLAAVFGGYVCMCKVARKGGFEWPSLGRSALLDRFRESATDGAKRHSRHVHFGQINRLASRQTGRRRATESGLPL